MVTMIMRRLYGALGYPTRRSSLEHTEVEHLGKMARRTWGVAKRAALVGSLGLVCTSAACSLDNLLKNDELPPDISDPAIVHTPEGAVAAYYGTIDRFRGAFGGDPTTLGVVGFSGVLTDELQSNGTAINSQHIADLRLLAEGEESREELNDPYGSLQLVRGQASQAIGLLTRYAADKKDLIGHTYTLVGYAEVFLAELYCSGIPLSTLDFDGDFTYHPGSTTEQVLEHALAKFDSASALLTDSTRFVHLTQLGRARALLGLGRFQEAAAAVAGVPDQFRYDIEFSANMRSFLSTNPSALIWSYTMADRQGLNGLDFRSSGDPRTPTAFLGISTVTGVAIYHPAKYAQDGSTPIVLASGLEARLIEAEAALREDRAEWLDILNALRTDGNYTTTPNPNDPAQLDTLWHAGIGGVAGLAPLTDPGSFDARVDLLFRERAFWLFLTGQRQGDLRRLIRFYGRSQNQVYPIGGHAAIPGASFGTDTDIPVPMAERVSNPKYTGCISRGA